MGSERGASVEAKQGGKKQGLKAPKPRPLAVRHQGQVVACMRALMGGYHLLEAGHNRAKGMRLVEPVGQEMHASIRQTGRALDKRCARGTRAMAWRLTRAALTTIELPVSPPAVDMAEAHCQRSLSFGSLVEEHPTRALRVLVEQGSQQGLLHVAELSSSTKGWT